MELEYDDLSTASAAQQRGLRAVLDPGSSSAVALILGGLIGLVASTVLLVEKIKILVDPSYVPSCSLNPVLSCGSVMTTPEAEVFGFPNPVIGVAAFSALLGLGVAIAAGAKLARWFWLLALGIVSLGFIFVHWLIAQSLYDIGALCPYCMVVWVVTAAVFVHVVYVNVEEFCIRGPEAVQRVAYGFVRRRSWFLALWLLVVAVLIAIRFWSYWKTLV